MCVLGAHSSQKRAPVDLELEFQRVVGFHVGAGNQMCSLKEPSLLLITDPSFESQQYAL